MQTARDYVTNTTAPIEHTFNVRSVLPKSKKYVRKEIIRDLGELLTREEQRLCDAATD